MRFDCKIFNIGRKAKGPVGASLFAVLGEMLLKKRPEKHTAPRGIRNTLRSPPSGSVFQGTLIERVMAAVRYRRTRFYLHDAVNQSAVSLFWDYFKLQLLAVL